MSDRVEIPDFLFRTQDGRLRLELSLKIYSLAAVFRACYVFTDRCYLYITPAEHDRIHVYVKSKSERQRVEEVAGDFCNQLIDQQLRVDLAKETGPIRELIVAQAFGEGNLLGDDRRDANPADDPLHIGESE